MLATNLISSQEVKVFYHNKPLNDVLLDLRDKYNLFISYNQTDISKYNISIDSTFISPKELLYYSVSKLPFIIKKINSVFVLTPKVSVIKIFGRITDIRSGEGIPYSTIILKNSYHFANELGYFSLAISTPENALLKLTFASMGFVLKDTVVSKMEFLDIKLETANILLKNIILTEFESSNGWKNSDLPGGMKINQLFARSLPGNGDNTIFNLLRLIPGIRASGEPSSFSVWESKPGESAIFLDNAKIFSMNGFNEQISSINPYIAKDIMLYKGGYGPKYGNQTGAVAEISALDGNYNKIESKFNINNLTANFYTSLPIKTNSAITLAYRQTYSDLYSISSLNPYGNREDSDFYVVPKYNFKDLNLKYSMKLGSNSSVFATTYAARDDFAYSLTSETLDLKASEFNLQYAYSINYINNNEGNETSVSVKSSYLNTITSKIIKQNRLGFYNLDVDNSILESGINISHKTKFSEIFQIDGGVSGNYFLSSENGLRLEALNTSIYINNRSNLNSFAINLGFRADHFKSKLYLQPRLSIKYLLNKQLDFSGSWGIYNQFTGEIKSIYVDAVPSITWRILGTTDYPVLQSEHLVGGINYKSKRVLITSEVFYKHNHGISQIFQTNNSTSVANGTLGVIGINIFSKYEKRGWQLFGSLSYSSVNEDYPDHSYYHYSPAEFKLGGVFNILPFTLSLDFIYGDGFLDTYSSGRYVLNSPSNYERFDISFSYAHNWSKIKLKSGISILNLFNHYNQKILDLLPVQRQGSTSLLQNLYTESIPFTPTIYLEVIF